MKYKLNIKEKGAEEMGGGFGWESTPSQKVKQTTYS